MRRVSWYTAVVAAAVAAGVYAAALTPAEQVSREGNVTVKVVPRSFSPNQLSWDFDVTLETHVQALDQDLAKVAALVDAQGNPHAALGWEGDPPGGHHRHGVLRFRPLPDDTSVVVLRLQGIGGVDTRVFRWQRER